LIDWDVTLPSELHTHLVYLHSTFTLIDWDVTLPSELHTHT